MFGLNPPYIGKNNNPAPRQPSFWERLLGYEPDYRPPPDGWPKSQDKCQTDGNEEATDPGR